MSSWTPERVLADTSPLIGLARIGHLELLQRSAEAIALAQSMESSLLLVDHARTRLVAQQLGLRLLGTVGLLRRAKTAGWITELRPLLENLQRHGIFISQRLIDAALADVGE